jgi:uncharacterized coiled-coil DUF342 family protein
MFARISKQLVTGARRFSNEAETQLETWIKINDRMHLEAASKAEVAVSGVKADVAALRGEVKVDVATLRTEVGALKNDVSQVKTDMAAFRNEVKNEVNELRKGQVEIHKEISRLHNQSSNQTRLILAGGATIASAFFAANQYIEYTKSKNLSKPAVK